MIMDDRMEVWLGDITRLKVDAVVNAANNQLAGGSGVDGAIHRAAGAGQLQEACRRIGFCATGEAVVTPAFALPAKCIIHTVGPVWNGGHAGEPELLRSCYSACLTLAVQEGARSVAFPAISCGAYGYPREEAAQIAVDEVERCLEVFLLIDRVVFACFDDQIAALYQTELARR